MQTGSRHVHLPGIGCVIKGGEQYTQFFAVIGLNPGGVIVFKETFEPFVLKTFNHVAFRRLSEVYRVARRGAKYAVSAYGDIFHKAPVSEKSRSFRREAPAGMGNESSRIVG